MTQLKPELYFIVIDLAGFAVYLAEMRKNRRRAEGSAGILLILVCLAGGTAGAALAVLLFDRRPDKKNSMAAVFIVTLLIVQTLVFLAAKGYAGDRLSLDLRPFFARHPFLAPYLALVNAVTLAAFALDKSAAVRGRRRIRISVLLGLAFAGGSAGALAGMVLFRHKTRKNYFAVGVPMILIMQTAVLLFLAACPEL